jgi:anti-anti-sigma factor
VGVGKATGEVVVRLVGEAGIRQADEVTSALLGLSALRPPLVTVDLSGLNAVSCLTLGVLVTFRRGIVRAGGRVRLAAALREPVRVALEQAGLLALFGPPELA